MDDARLERIRRKAYELWELEGGAHGRHDDHWSEAERIVADEDAPKSKAPRKRAAKGAPGVSGPKRTGA